ncbi:ATP-binding protein [Saccharopolyspora spinosa]|uniref:ATP-binding protein n=1 Tax=Saccharopolyspora spinosa TaxID=60894 RepID=UPI00376EDCC2
MLIVLDNCEHVLGAAGSVVSALLGSARGVRVLATSREWLRVTGEQAFPVPPLAVPGVDSSDDGRALDHGVAEYEAVTLLEERAVAVLPGFRVDRDNEEAVARLCRRLDGLPLAIELAAVRLRMLSLEQILQRIEDRFRLLTTKHRGALARHQTLRAAVEWSFGLCSPAEQVLWARLSVFAGEFDLEAAEQVCAGAAWRRRTFSTRCPGWWKSQWCRRCSAVPRCGIGCWRPSGSTGGSSWRFVARRRCCGVGTGTIT